MPNVHLLIEVRSYSQIASYFTPRLNRGSSNLKFRTQGSFYLSILSSFLDWMHLIPS